ncbi:ankyrin repeat-containing protein ITN1-like [Salvia hispanica]|uniref:ankyrin repeat-containing protein ITN1-like n=1 Tax=Salvia hispanica TaxID=49212 RepID=UPI00200924E4|nr:ankyrin repeat-containing protein ITN1-like [Salvia hispanica]
MVSEKEIYDAASEGDATKFAQLVQQDPNLVYRVSFPCSRNLLHIATLLGKVDIVEELLNESRQLALELDSNHSSPLHIAAAKGNLEIARKLLSVAPEMCWSRNDQGLNPIHVAAMKGHVDLLKELLEKDPLPAMERVYRGQTVLHLCVKHRQHEALEFLVDKLGELVYAKDDDMETLMHWAVRSRQYETVELLVRSGKIEMDSMNSMGRTATQIFADDKQQVDWRWLRLMWSFISVSALLGIPSEMLSKRREQTMVVMALIAAMAFQATISPPGGVWQDNTSLKAGQAVIASTQPKIYKHFVRANAAAFISSLMTICLVAVPVRIGGSGTLFLTTSTVWVAVASIAFSYGASVLVVSPYTQALSFTKITNVIVSITVIAYFLVALWSLLSIGYFKLVFKLSNKIMNTALESLLSHAKSDSRQPAQTTPHPRPTTHPESDTRSQPVAEIEEP